MGDLLCIMLKAYLPLLLILIFASCRKEKFSSESEWVVPVFQTSLSLKDLLPDSLTTYNPDSSLNLVFEEEYGISELSDILKIPDKVDTMEVTLSSLVLDDRAFTDTLTLAEIYPPSILLNGRMASLDAQDITANEGTVIDVTDQFFTKATFIEGWIDIEIHNDLPVEAELLEFELKNNADKAVIVSGVFENLLPNESVKDSFSLAGKTVDGVLELLVKRVKTKASDGEVQVNAFKGLRIDFSVRGLRPQEATAIFPAQNLVENKEETKYQFGGAKLTQIIVNEGFVLIDVESSIQESIILEYTIPNSEKNYDNIPIKKTWTIPAAAPGQKVAFTERFSIEGYSINMFGETNKVEPNFNRIYNELVARIEYSGIERTLSLEDKISIKFGLVDVKPRLIIGDPGLHKIEVLDSLKLDPLNNLSGQISLEDASLDLDFANTFGIEATIDVKEITARNETAGTAVNLTGSDISTPIFLGKGENTGFEIIPFNTSISLNKSNSNFKQFIENLPNKITTDVLTTVRPFGTVNQNDFAFDTSKIIMNAKLEVPMQLGLNGLLLSNNLNVNLFQNEDLNKVKAGRLTIFLDNSFPINGNVDVYFYDDLDSLVLDGFSNETNRFEGAEVDPSSGKTVGSLETEVILDLSPSEMTQLQHATKVKFLVHFNTKDAKRYKMYSDYNVNVKAVAEVVYEQKI